MANLDWSGVKKNRQKLYSSIYEIISLAVIWIIFLYLNVEKIGSRVHVYYNPSYFLGAHNTHTSMSEEDLLYEQ